MQIEILIQSIPIAEPRKRVRVANGIAMHYTPKRHKVNDFKQAAKIAAKASLRCMSPLTGPIAVELLYVMPRTLNQVWKTKPMPRLPHDKKPDLDNLQKSTWDALNGIVWHDDSQICELVSKKVIASGYEQPHVVLRVWEIEQKREVV